MLRDDGTEIRKVTDRQVQFALLSPVGDYIFYLSAVGDIFKQDIETGQEEKVTDLATSFNISPDGRYLSFLKLPSTWQPGEMGYATKGISILDTQTSEERLLTQRESDYVAYWTPDGQHLLVPGVDSEGDSALFLVTHDGSTSTQLTGTTNWHYVGNEQIPSVASVPLISPDGRIIVYEGDRDVWMLELNQEKSALTKAKCIAYGTNPKWVEEGKTFTAQSADSTLILIDL